MYRNIIIGLLLSGCISSFVTSQQNVTSPEISTSTVKGTAPGNHSTDLRATEKSVTRSHPVTGKEQTGARQQFKHAFSEGVIIAIIFLVMAAIIVIILLLTYSIRKLRERRSPVNAPPQNTDDPLSSVETGSPVPPENNNE